MTASTATIINPVAEDLARVTLAIAVARGSVARGGSIDLSALEGAVAALRTAAGEHARQDNQHLDHRLSAVEHAFAALARELDDACREPARNAWLAANGWEPSVG